MTIAEIIEYLNELTTEEDTAKRLYWEIVSPAYHPTKLNGEVWDKILKLRDKVDTRSHARGDYEGDSLYHASYDGETWTWTRNPTLKAVTEALGNFITVSKDMCEINHIALTPMGASLFNTIDSYCKETVA